MDIFHIKLVKMNRIIYRGLGFSGGGVWKLPELLAILKFKGKSQYFFHLGKDENSICDNKHHANLGTFSLKTAVSRGSYLFSK